ncbi:MAG: Dihydrolipoyllysine-residue succinyltransferase component of 2-oxoglutarate dehydrogenase complex [Planctomycetes bacterium]|nr:Dihydrolipoyllysine-residue succinyltransferase component of 2-oxoglutarate dehydrogenase complex [Planctomycetota bacterium]
MAIELKIPSVGESITEVIIGTWIKHEGDAVETDEPIVEIDSDKASQELGAPAGGVIKRLLKKEGDTAQVGEVIALIEENGKQKPRAKARGDAGPKPASTQAAPASEPKPAEPRVMPAAKRMLDENKLSPADVTPTGPGGRVLKEDVQQVLERKAPPPPSAGKLPAPQGLRETETVRMSTLRKRLAQRLVEAQQTAAILTTFNEIDMGAVMQLRAQHKDAFQQKHGVKLGFMSFFVKAAVDALRLVPQVNGRIEGDNIVYHNYQDIGVAVGGGRGLVVPVLRNAERMSFAEVELAIADFGRRAQSNEITPDEMQGGTFTISNGGVYGSLLSTPILNPPQSGILGMHAIQDRPMAVNGQVVIRPMMYVALSYDHRIIDGREAVTFLKRIKECVEDPTRMLMEI